VTSEERDATWHFYDQLGQRLHIAQRAASYSNAEHQLREYESKRLAPSSEGARLTAAVLATLRDRIPAPGRPFAGQITSALVGDPTVSRALGLPAPRPALASVLAAAAGLRRLIQRRLPPPVEPSFWPGRPAGTIYPDGYTLDQLGPKGR
jgi:hypothetical protein